jgi:hypothetical protein
MRGSHFGGFSIFPSIVFSFSYFLHWLYRTHHPVFKLLSDSRTIKKCIYTSHCTPESAGSGPNYRFQKAAAGFAPAHCPSGDGLYLKIPTTQ